MRTIRAAVAGCNQGGSKKLDYRHALMTGFRASGIHLQWLARPVSARKSAHQTVTQQEYRHIGKREKRYMCAETGCALHLRFIPRYGFFVV
jgi:hypothetical protein